MIRNSFVNGEIWPDDRGIHINAHGGGIVFHSGRYYWFGEHKISGEDGNRAYVGIGAYSSSDLYNWKNEGIAFSVEDENSGHELAAGCVIERPKVVFNAMTGKFVMWFHLEHRDTGYNTARSGVAVSDNITGPYRFVRSFRPNNSEARDMTVFLDDDGKAYHFYSSENNQTMHVSLLSEDYLSESGKYERIFAGRSMEAPAICKHNGKYYFVGSGCTGWDPNPARSAVAESIWGPWEETGNPCRGEGADMTFMAQSTFILPVNGAFGKYIFMADIWRPKNAIDGRYIWLPVDFTGKGISLEWIKEWNL